MSRRSIFGLASLQRSISRSKDRSQRRADRRRMLFEPLERRELLVSDFTNPLNALDVSNDGVVSPLDALQVINDLNQNGSRKLTTPTGPVEFFVDTNADCNITPIDALLIINAINADSDGPSVTVALQNDTAPGNATNNDQVTSDATLVGTATDLTGISRLEAAINGGPRSELPIARDGSFALSPTLADGLHQISFFATDGVGNEGSAQISITLDTTPPTIDGFGLTPDTDTGTSNTDGVTNLSDVTLEGNTETGATVTLSLAGQVIDTQVASSPVRFNVTGLADGDHSFQAIAEDVAGNIGASVDADIVVDSIAPTLTIDAPMNNDIVGPDSRLVGTLADQGDERLVEYQFDNGPTNLIAITASGKIDGRLAFNGVNEGLRQLQVRASDQAGNVASETIIVDVQLGLDKLTLTGVEPRDGQQNVSVTFRPRITFNRPIDATTLTDQSFFVSTGGGTISSTIVPSTSNDFAWLFPTAGLPGNSRVTLTVDGNRIATTAGDLLDADGDGTPGGLARFSFTTGSTIPIMGTSLSGIARDPGPDRLPNTLDDAALSGVEVFLLGRENDKRTTDFEGRFTLDSVPSGIVQITLDGTTANGPSGVFFPELVLNANMLPGQVNFPQPGVEEVFLPRLNTSILSTVSAASGALIVASDAGAQELPQAQRQLLSINVPPDSFIAPNGTKLSSAQVGISTLPASLIANMFPPGALRQTFGITVQAPGVANFASPASVTFPNIFNAAPGTQLYFVSFDHTTGLPVLEGTATVSLDRLTVTTDPGVGVTRPGWHGLTIAGSQVIGGDGGQHFVAIETPTVAGSPVLRDLTGDNGRYEFFLPAETAFRVVRFDPASGLVSEFEGITEVSGRDTIVPSTAFLASVAPDNDGDGLPADVEFAIGTSDNDPDSNNDNISDSKAITAGLNPLGDVASITGTLGAAPITGTAVAVDTGTAPLDPNQSLAFVATGLVGISIVDVSDPALPIVLSELNLPGDNQDLAYIPSEGLLIVAAGDAGLHLVDITNPSQPVFDETISTEGSANRVANFGLTPFIAGGSRVAQVDLLAGTVINAIEV